MPIGEAREYLFSEKHLLPSRSWEEKKNRDGKTPALFHESRVRLGATMPRGLKFRITIFPKFPDTATFQLDCDQAPSLRTRWHLYRLDWGPISPHANPMHRWVPDELRGTTFACGETHDHICLDHLYADGATLRSPGVHAARRVTCDLSSYDAALAYVCDKLKIINGRDIPPSNAQWILV